MVCGLDNHVDVACRKAGRQKGRDRQEWAILAGLQNMNLLLLLQGWFWLIESCTNFSSHWHWYRGTGIWARHDSGLYV
ncbi:hypothetical protein BBL07_07900 [Agrobacterium vitis]|nr:hypothetical protein BBL07_07900 [Agrobacterium vitis]